METTVRNALVRQFDAVIDMLENAIVACPTSLWTQRLWPDLPQQPRPTWLPAEFAEFWYLAYHAIFWLDLYLSGAPEEEFIPLAPFTRAVPELDPEGVPLEQPYTKEELLAYVAALRDKCRVQLGALTAERAAEIVDYPWAQGRKVSYLELQLYTMRHVQDHASQLNLFLGQSAIEAPPDWVGLGKDKPNLP